MRVQNDCFFFLSNCERVTRNIVHLSHPVSTSTICINNVLAVHHRLELWLLRVRNACTGTVDNVAVEPVCQAYTCVFVDEYHSPGPLKP